MARLTQTTRKAAPAAPATRKAAPKLSAPELFAPELSAPISGEPFTFTFQAPAGHISTGKTLAVYKGRGRGGVDIYVPLALFAKELGYMPEEAEFSITITPLGAALENPVVAVPKTMQNRFDKGTEYGFEEVYGTYFQDFLDDLANGAPEEAAPQRMAAGTRRAPATRKAVPAAPKAVTLRADASFTRQEKQAGIDAVKRAAGTRGQHSEAASMSQRMDELSETVSKLAAIIIAGKGK